MRPLYCQDTLKKIDFFFFGDFFIKKVIFQCTCCVNCQEYLLFYPDWRFMKVFDEDGGQPSQPQKGGAESIFT